METQKILFPTDFSPNSGNALYYAMHLAGALGAEIELFHCYTYPDIMSEGPIPRVDEEIKTIEKCKAHMAELIDCLLYTSPSPRDS